MKQSIIVTIILFLFLSKSYSDSIGKDSLAVIKFEKTKYNFGKIKEGKTYFCTYKFKNTGAKPLIVTHVSNSCGCTRAVWTREPILPGKIGEIEVKFMTYGKSGLQIKYIDVKSNAKNSLVQLTLKAKIKKKR